MSFTPPTDPRIPPTVALALLSFNVAFAPHRAGAVASINPLVTLRNDVNLLVAYMLLCVSVWRSPRPWRDALFAASPEGITGQAYTTVAATRHLLSNVSFTVKPTAPTE